MALTIERNLLLPTAHFSVSKAASLLPTAHLSVSKAASSVCVLVLEQRARAQGNTNT